VSFANLEVAGILGSLESSGATEVRHQSITEGIGSPGRQAHGTIMSRRRPSVGNDLEKEGVVCDEVSRIADRVYRNGARRRVCG